MKLNDTTESKLPANVESLNPLGMAGLVVSLLGFACCLFTVLYCASLSVEKPEPNPIEGNFLPPGSFSIFQSLFVSVVGLIGGITGGAVSVIGFFLSLAGMFGRGKLIAEIGMLAGLAGPILIWWALTR